VDRPVAAELLGRLHREQNAFYAGGDDGELRSLLRADVVWHVPGSNPIAGDYHGIDEVFGYFNRRRSIAGNTMQMHPGDVLVGDGESVAAVTDGTATIGGVNHRWSTVGLYRIVDERIAECWLLPLNPATFDLAWSRIS
jgi:ketosteroid isomerase-like protein